MSRQFSKKLKRIERELNHNQATNRIKEVSSYIQMYFSYYEAVALIEKGEQDRDDFPIMIDCQKNGNHKVTYPTGKTFFMNEKEIKGLSRPCVYFEEDKEDIEDSFIEKMTKKYLD